MPGVADKVVVVTGAASGQGAAEARALARAAHGQALGTWIGERYGRVDGLVNNAGIPHRARLAEVTLVA